MSNNEPLINKHSKQSKELSSPEFKPIDEREKTKNEVKKEFKEAFNKENYDLDEAAHPVVCIFTVVFKGVAFLIYLFLGALFLNEILTFVLVTLCTVFDFWTMKNVSGRLLVGMRWWNTMDKNGGTKFRFESYDQEFQSNRVDSFFFWTSLIVNTIIWGVFLVLNVLSFALFWSILNGFCFFMSALNLYGYYKCRSDHSGKIKKYEQFIKTEGFKKAGNYFLNKI